MLPTPGCRGSGSSIPEQELHRRGSRWSYSASVPPCAVSGHSSARPFMVLHQTGLGEPSCIHLRQRHPGIRSVFVFGKGHSPLTVPGGRIEGPGSEILFFRGSFGAFQSDPLSWCGTTRFWIFRGVSWRLQKKTRSFESSSFEGYN